MLRVHYFISGMVQGVSFRYFVTKIAEDLDLTGWVRNLPDGRVECVAEGQENNVEKFLRMLNKGSVLSRVDKVKVEKEEYIGNFSDFKIIH